MAILILDNNYKIESSENQWTLKYEKIGGINKDTGKNTISKNEYFHNSLENALKSYVDKKLKNSESLSIEIKDLIQKLDALKSIINNINR